jgi:acyl-CoA synthetase (AMP-forming)/AMP-acid ligase II
MAGLLAPMVRRAPAGPALAGDRATLRWAELDGRVNQWVDLFRGAGLSTGDRVAFVTGNRPVTFEALLACLHAGLVAVPVSWRFTAAEIAYLLADSGSRAVLTESAYASKVADAVRQAGARPVLALVAGDQEVAGLAAAEKALAGADTAEPAGQCSGSVMLYTSATTGRPKGVVTGLLAPGADLDRVRRTTGAVGEAFGIPEHGRGLLVGPWYHAAQVFFSLFPLLRGCGLVLRQRFDAAATLADLARERITVCHLVPTQFVRLLGLDSPTRARFAPAHLRQVWHGGAACPVEVKRRMIEWWGPVLTEYYAATEAGIVTTIDSEQWLARPGSVGRPVPPTEVLILDTDGTQLPPGRTGSVYIRRSPRRGFEYHNAPAKTAAAYRTPGTFTVGDLGHLDSDGYLYLTGRTLDTIISGGVNIYPAEVEAALVEHPAVRDAAVFGIPDEEFGERVMAAVELAPDTTLSTADVPEELDAHCRRHLAGYKRPRAYAVVGELPREPTGKLNRRALRDPYWGG